MTPLIKAEFKKIFTVRSTYIILLLSFAALIIFAFLGSGIKIDHKDLLFPFTLSNDITSATSALAVFPALIALLLFTHEYRHNTIMYTLTLSNSRNKVLLAKVLVVSIFSIIYILFFSALSPLLSLLGVHLAHLHMAHQTIYYRDLLWKVVLFGWAYALIGLLFAVLIRNQIGAAIALLIAPETVEGLLSILLKKNTVYLPFTALHTVIGQGMNITNTITPVHAALVFSVWFIVGWIIGWILFLRRDAV